MCTLMKWTHRSSKTDNLRMRPRAMTSETTLRAALETAIFKAMVTPPLREVAASMLVSMKVPQYSCPSKSWVKSAGVPRVSCKNSTVALANSSSTNLRFLLCRLVAPRMLGCECIYAHIHK